MIIAERPFNVNGLSYTIRSAAAQDAEQLSGLRVQIDGETENLDREPGEAFIDAPGFVKLIQADSDSAGNLFLVAAVEDRIVGYSRCQGNELIRFSHKVEFGVGVLKEFWGYGIGKHLLQTSIDWADSIGMAKMTLTVLETNEKAVRLYEKLGFEVEGVLRKDKLLSDGTYYSTLVMGRLNE
ncbi:GNAT family N-acetyltransferase [Paenibacillus chitinolyticus]|uniref:GNAT family N-acetyltransferase n=1 Tax=Paenibacillus chitinolyticus TaxID=79263 RepID=UPI00386CC607